jgi:hypothetical protein
MHNFTKYLSIGLIVVGLASYAIYFDTPYYRITGVFLAIMGLLSYALRNIHGWKLLWVIPAAVVMGIGLQVAYLSVFEDYRVVDGRTSVTDAFPWLPKHKFGLQEHLLYTDAVLREFGYFPSPVESNIAMNTAGILVHRENDTKFAINTFFAANGCEAARKVQLVLEMLIFEDQTSETGEAVYTALGDCESRP